MRCIAVINQKGGVGKTTTSINLSHALAKKGYKVVAIDMDPQSHMGLGMGVTRQKIQGVDNVFLGDSELDEVMLDISNNIKLVPAGQRLAEVATGLKGGAERGRILQRAIRSSSSCKQSDFVILDCPPSAGLLGMNAIFSADELMIPVSSDFLALHGVSRMVNIIDYVDETLKQKSRKWFVVTRYHERRRLSQEVRSKLQEHFSGDVLVTPVRESVALAESPGFGQSIFDYQPKGNGAEDYLNLADDLLNERVM